MLNTSSAQVGESVSNVEPNPEALWLATKIVENAKSIVLLSVVSRSIDRVIKHLSGCLVGRQKRVVSSQAICRETYKQQCLQAAGVQNQQVFQFSSFQCFISFAPYSAGRFITTFQNALQLRNHCYACPRWHSVRSTSSERK